jgi:hypothetical protein
LTKRNEIKRYRIAVESELFVCSRTTVPCLRLRQTFTSTKRQILRFPFSSLSWFYRYRSICARRGGMDVWTEWMGKSAESKQAMNAQQRRRALRAGGGCSRSGGSKQQQLENRTKNQVRRSSTTPVSGRAERRLPAGAGVTCLSVRLSGGPQDDIAQSSAHLTSTYLGGGFRQKATSYLPTSKQSTTIVAAKHKVK